MSSNTFGNLLKMTTFGESHGQALGLVMDNFPAGVKISLEQLQEDLNRRRPGQNDLVSSRKESDQLKVFSGIYEGKSLGSPICIVVYNQDARSEDYEKIKLQARTGHADDVWKNKFQHTDHRGGGRSSGRETLARVLAGSLAKQMLQHLYPKLLVSAFSSQIYSYQADIEKTLSHLKDLKQNQADQWLDTQTAKMPFSDSDEIKNLLKQAKEEGKSYGGVSSVYVRNPPASLGQPVFNKLKADFAKAFMSVGATHSFQLGRGLDTTKEEGSTFHQKNQALQYGGIRGGISSGDDLYMEVGVKPTASVLDIAKKGRHDPCILPRICPVLQAMTFFVLADHVLLRQKDQIDKIHT